MATTPRDMYQELAETGRTLMPRGLNRHQTYRVKLIERNPKGMIVSVGMWPGEIADYWNYLSNSRLLLHLPCPEDSGYLMNTREGMLEGGPATYFWRIGAVSCCHYRIMERGYDIVAIQNCFRMKGSGAPPRRIATKYGGCQGRLMETVFRLAIADGKSRVRFYADRTNTMMRFREVADVLGYKLLSSCRAVSEVSVSDPFYTPPVQTASIAV